MIIWIEESDSDSDLRVSASLQGDIVNFLQKKLAPCIAWVRTERLATLLTRGETEVIEVGVRVRGTSVVPFWDLPLIRPGSVALKIWKRSGRTMGVSAAHWPSIPKLYRHKLRAHKTLARRLRLIRQGTLTRLEAICPDCGTKLNVQVDPDAPRLQACCSSPMMCHMIILYDVEPGIDTPDWVDQSPIWVID